MKFVALLFACTFLGSGISQSPQASRPQASVSGNACPRVLEASMMHMHQAMSSVTTTGAFDSDFMKLMIPHHEAGLEMAKAELLCGKDLAARRLAQEIIADQSSEIDLMKLLLKQDSEHHSTSSSQPSKDKK